jgi:formate hydrogenlyase transcriptional activator
MTPDPQAKYHSFSHLCQALRSAANLPAAFRHAAEEIHATTGCDRVGLLLKSDGPGKHPGYLADFAGTPSPLETAAECMSPSAVAWVLQHRQPKVVRRLNAAESSPGDTRPVEQDMQACVYLPLVCRGEAIGLLALASGHEDEMAGWDMQHLSELAGLLALAVDDFLAQARIGELQRFQREMVYLRDEIKTDRDLRLLTGDSPGMKAVRLAVQQVARTDSTVLILGETGTGKELVARAIHQLSPRRDHLLVAVNCAALAPGVIASELFGHEPGAFTGATKRRLGRFELAHRGTLFLDEVGELPLEMQVLLLRALQERVIERVGGGEPIAVDVRVLAATHRDLVVALGQGRFRADLFFRLNVFPIHVPPLRERREDIPDLVRHFLHHFGRRMNKPVAQVSPATLRLLMDYPWPGNVRELENIIERALIVTTGDTLQVDPHWLAPTPGANSDAARPALAELERRAILDALERCHGKIYGQGGAAAALGLKPTTLYGKMRKHRITKKHGPR